MFPQRRPLLVPRRELEPRSLRWNQLAFALFAWCGASGAVAADWTQWGGPHGDFTVREGPTLAEAWPAAGPRLLWQRPLGDGYSAVLCKEGRLFTQYHADGREFVAALDAKSGATIWAEGAAVEWFPDMVRDYGPGPNATPLILGQSILSIGIAGKLSCRDLASGALRWQHDLTSEFGRTARKEEYGYSTSPLPYHDIAIVLVGGKAHAAMAFDPQDGSVVWKSEPRGVSYAQPAILHLAGRDQLVFFSPTEVVSLDPTNGRLLWTYPCVCSTENNLTPAIACDSQHVWIAAQLDGGTRLLRIDERNGRMAPTERWFDAKLTQTHWNSIRLGDYIYGCEGGNSTSTFSAIHWPTGAIAWRRRGYHAAKPVYADGKVLFVDEAGDLVLARVSPTAISVLAEFPLLDSVSWTAPTLVDGRVYVRDRKQIVALDLTDPTR